MKIKTRFIKSISVIATLLFFIQAIPAHADSMSDYCVVPPYVKTDVTPNILILFDNSQINGGPAYPTSTFATYDSTKTYPGIFKKGVLYVYGSNRWEPSTLFVGGIRTGLDGNVLNWATTSRYDLIEVVLLGGKSTSRQTNVNTLIGYSAGLECPTSAPNCVWIDKTYTYTGTDGAAYTCVFKVNVSDRGNLTISDGSAQTCGLIQSTPVYPQTSLNDIPLFRYASYNPSQETATPQNNQKFNLLEIVNKIMGFISSDAEAAGQPLKMTKPKFDDTDLGTVNQGASGEDISIYSCQASGGCNNCTYTWSATNLPAGIVIDATGTTAGLIHGDTSALSGGDYGGITVTVTDGSATVTRINLIFHVSVGPVTSRQYNIAACAGDYTNNCNTTNAELKSGLLQQYLTQAQWGFMDFANSLSPNGEICIPQNNDNNFYNAIENAVPVGDTTNITKLVDGEHEAVLMYKAVAPTINCDPFSGDTKTCRKNFILMLTAGEGADNPNPPTSPVGGFPNPFDDPDSKCTSDVFNLSKNSCYAYRYDIRSDLNGTQKAQTFIVNAMGELSDNDPGTTTKGDILKEAATAGGGSDQYFEVTDPTLIQEKIEQALKDILRRAASGTAASVLASGEGQGANLIQAVFYPRTQKIIAGGIFDREIAWIGRLTNLWYYVDPFFTTSAILDDSSGASPPQLGVGTPDKKLNLANDKTVRFRFDTAQDRTVADLYPYGSTTLTTTIPFEYAVSLWEAGLELWNRDISSIPRTIYTPLDTSFSLTSSANWFSTSNAGTGSTLREWLNTDVSSRSATQNTTVAENLINYIHGNEISTYTDIDNNGTSFTEYYRTRLVAVDLNGNGTTTNTVTINGTSISESEKVWKLGDVLNSTPKISSWIPLNNYHKTYMDDSYGMVGSDPKLSAAEDTTHFITSNIYRDRGMVFAGANDGMLHAIKLGKLELKDDAPDCTLTGDEKACLANPSSYLGGSTNNFGKELWAFIPKNALPYLKYIKDPTYCHVYTVDLSPYIFDASIGVKSRGDVSTDTRDATDWRTILIGGMRFGGACRDSGGSCSSSNCSVTTSTSCSSNSDCPAGEKCLPNCVKTPLSGKGFSSYFALDITDQNNPEFLWEFTDSQLGFTTPGPVIVRINAKNTSTGNPDKSLNGKWFVVLGSGPTGPIDSITQQFLGRSDQPLRIFVLDLKTGNLLRTINTSSIISSSNAFAGSMLNATHDADVDYQDDVLYIPYVKTSGGTWTDGGVLRIITGTTATPAVDATLPNNWKISTVMDGIGGPVTSTVVRLQKNSGCKNPSGDEGCLWLYFGTGRYYFEQATTIDDPTNRRSLFGVKEPCFSAPTGTGTFSNINCSTGASVSTDVTSISNVPSETDANASGFTGWRIDLDNPGSYTYNEGGTNVTRDYRAERLITDPLSTTTGLVFFTTYKPYTDICSLGGKSFIWALRYNTGGAPGALLKGKALVQVSTGSIEQVDLSTQFDPTRTDSSGGRKSNAMEGVPPVSQGLSLLSTPPPVKRVMHLRER